MTGVVRAAVRRGIRLPDTIRGLFLLGVVWEMAGRATADAYVLAAPSDIVRFLAGNGPLMARALAETSANAVWGYLLGNAAAVTLAVLAVLWPRSERIVAGLALLVFCLPLVATGPILRVLFGPGAGPQIALAALAVYYTTLIPLLVGLRAAPQSWFDLVQSYGRGRWAALVHVRARASLPYLFAGLQIAAPAAFLGAMVGEFTGAERGMGVLTVRAIRALDVEMTWTLASVAAGVSIAVYAAIGALSRWFVSDAPPVLLAAAPAVARSWRHGVADALLVLAVAVALWWAALELGQVNAFFAKRPDDILMALTIGEGAATLRATLAAALWETSRFLVPGYVAGLAAGAGLAVALILVPRLSGLAMPLAVTLRSVPIVTTAPLVVLLLGRGAAGTIVLVALMVFFPTFVACLHGLRQAPGQVLDVFASFAARPWTRLALAQVPAMLPAFFAAARMAVPASVLAVTVVEWLATGRGLGSLMALSASLSDYSTLWSAVVVTAVLSALCYAGVGAVERRVLAVYAPEQLT